MATVQSSVYAYRGELGNTDLNTLHETYHTGYYEVNDPYVVTLRNHYPGLTWGLRDLDQLDLVGNFNKEDEDTYEGTDSFFNYFQITNEYENTGRHQAVMYNNEYLTGRDSSSRQDLFDKFERSNPYKTTDDNDDTPWQNIMIGGRIKKIHPTQLNAIDVYRHFKEDKKNVTGILEVRATNSLCEQRFYRFPDHSVWQRVFNKDTNKWTRWAEENPSIMYGHENQQTLRGFRHFRKWGNNNGMTHYMDRSFGFKEVWTFAMNGNTYPDGKTPQEYLSLFYGSTATIANTTLSNVSLYTDSGQYVETHGDVTEFFTIQKQYGESYSGAAQVNTQSGTSWAEVRVKKEIVLEKPTEGKLWYNYINPELEHCGRGGYDEHNIVAMSKIRLEEYGPNIKDSVNHDRFYETKYGVNNLLARKSNNRFYNNNITFQWGDQYTPNMHQQFYNIHTMPFYTRLNAIEFGEEVKLHPNGSMVSAHKKGVYQPTQMSATTNNIIQGISDRPITYRIGDDLKIRQVIECDPRQNHYGPFYYQIKDNSPIVNDIVNPLPSRADFDYNRDEDLPGNMEDTKYMGNLITDENTQFMVCENNVITADMLEVPRYIKFEDTEEYISTKRYPMTFVLRILRWWIWGPAMYSAPVEDMYKDDLFYTDSNKSFDYIIELCLQFFIVPGQYFEKKKVVAKLRDSTMTENVGFSHMNTREIELVFSYRKGEGDLDLIVHHSEIDGFEFEVYDEEKFYEKSLVYHPAERYKSKPIMEVFVQ